MIMFWGLRCSGAGCRGLEGKRGRMLEMLFLCCHEFFKVVMDVFINIASHNMRIYMIKKELSKIQVFYPRSFAGTDLIFWISWIVAIYQAISLVRL